jgi:hypothetical protein
MEGLLRSRLSGLTGRERAAGIEASGLENALRVRAAEHSTRDQPASAVPYWKKHY